MIWNPISWICWMTFLLIGLHVNADSIVDCLSQPNVPLVISGGCAEIHGKLITTGKELEFEMKYANTYKSATAARITFFVAGCGLSGIVTSTISEPATFIFKNLSNLPGERSLPIKVVLEAKEFVVYEGQKAIRNKCFDSNQPSEPGMIVAFNFTTDGLIPNFAIIFSTANIYKPDAPAEQEWSASGWRLWVSVIGGLILFVGIIVIVGLVYWFHKHKNEEARAPLKPKEPPSRYSKTEWNWPRSFHAADAEELQCCINSSDPEVVRDFVKSFPIHDARLIAQMRQWVAQMETEHQFLERRTTDEHSTLFNAYNTVKLFLRIWEEENAKLQK